MHAKTILVTLGVVLGIVIGYETQYATEIIIAAFILFVAQSVIYRLQIKREIESFALYLFIALVSFGIIIGALRVQFEDEPKTFTCSSCSFDAVVTETPQVQDAYQTIVVQSVGPDDTYNVQLRAPLYPTYEVGETLHVNGKAEVPQQLPGQTFDYLSYLHTRNIGSVMLYPKVEVMDTEPHTLSAILGRWKEDMIARVHRYVSSPASELGSGMLFGNAGLSKELTATFRVAGLSHIIVLSGFNIAIIIATVMFLCSYLPLVMRIFIAVTFVSLFVLMVGATPSVLRATIMAFISLVAILVRREYVARQALIISFAGIILYSPQSLLHDTSLHLSFLATAGIVYLSQPIKNAAGNYVNASIAELWSTTVAAYIATAPYIMYSFGQISLYALLANMIVLPFVSVSMLLTALVVMSSYLLPVMAMILGFADTLVLTLMIECARFIAWLPFSSVSLSLSLWGMILLYLSGVTICLFLFRKFDETFRTDEQENLTGVISY